MATTVDEIEHKINLLAKSPKIIKASRANVARIYNWEPFSVRKTATTLDQIFYKLLNSHKSTHNRKYLQSLFPYYVFYDSILDLDGKIVLLIRREAVNNYTTKYVFHVTKEFYSKYKDQVDYIHQMYGGNLAHNSEYNVRLEVEDIDDIYFIFHKQYTFDSISQVKDFKKILIGIISENLIESQKEYLKPVVELPC